jgi:hypothetical protein
MGSWKKGGLIDTVAAGNGQFADTVTSLTLPGSWLNFCLNQILFP